MVAETLLELYAVAIGNGNVVHVHTEHKTANVVSVSNSCCHACPYGYALLSLLALPVANDNLAGNTHAAAYVTELDVTMSRLVQIHEVHVDGVPGKLSVVLSVEVEKRLLQSLKTLDPHLCW